MYQIRQARREDFPAILHLTQLWKAEPSTTGHYAYNTEDSLATRLGLYFLVAENKGEVVGFIIGVVDDDTFKNLNYQVVKPGEHFLMIDQLYIHTNYRNQGIGSKLVETLFAEAHAQGIQHHIVFSENVDWQRTMHFYQKQGFRPWFFTMFTGKSTEERE